jgi:hypothetical protein
MRPAPSRSVHDPAGAGTRCESRTVRFRFVTSSPGSHRHSSAVRCRFPPKPTSLPVRRLPQDALNIRGLKTAS